MAVRIFRTRDKAHVPERLTRSIAHVDVKQRHPPPYLYLKSVSSPRPSHDSDEVDLDIRLFHHRVA